MDASSFTYLRLPSATDAVLANFTPLVADWFRRSYQTPTLVQRLAWPAILRREHLLVSAPTGSGKTLAAFLPILDELVREPRPGIRCLYLAPLKALCRDMRGNLRGHLARLGRTDLRVDARTGDTAHAVRARQLEHPPHILLTTPESLAVLLSQAAWHDRLADVRCVVLDEIHTLVGSKRGADAALSLERLDAVTNGCQRIGLSATCAPLDTVARFLVGVGRPCSIAHAPEETPMHVAVEMLGETDSPRTWHQTLAERIEHEIESQATTLIFANTRHLAERVAWNLKRRLDPRTDPGAESIAVHHSSLAPARRRLIERQLKQGRLRAVVSSASLDLGIDIGAVEGVVFVHPPGGVSRLLQRLGRSGHRPSQPRNGLMLVQSPAELLEGLVTLECGRHAQIEPLAIAAAPLDVLCQHLVGMAMTGPCHKEDSLALLRRAAPYAELTREDFERCLAYLSGRKADGCEWLPARVRWHDESFMIADASIAKLLRRNLGTIVREETHAVRLDQGDEKKAILLGELDEIFAQHLRPGDRFVLEGRALECRAKERDGVMVTEAMGRPSIPRWLGGGWAWPADLARRVFLWRAETAERLRSDGAGVRAEIAEFLMLQEARSEVPRETHILLEAVDRGFGVEYAVHTPLPRSGNEALAAVVAERLARRGRRARPPLAANLGFVMFLEGNAELNEDDWRTLLGADGWDADVERVVHGSPLVRVQFTRVAQTGLMVLRHPLGGRRKVGGRDWAGRELFDEVLRAEPSFVLLEQARREVRAESFDFTLARAWLDAMQSRPTMLRWLAHLSPLAESWFGNPAREPLHAG